MIYFNNLNLDFFPNAAVWIKIIGAGKTGINALSYIKDVDKDNSFVTLAVPDKNFIANSRAEILDFISGTNWLLVIADIEDVEDLSIAECIGEIKSHCELITSIILCPSAEDERLKNIPDNFGTWIILPKDKIAATGLTNNEIIYQIIDKITCVQSMDILIGLDFADVVATLKNGGRACIGFSKSVDAENNSLVAVKNALKSPLFIEDIGKAKKVLLAFVGNVEFLIMLEANEAATFLDNELPQSENIFDGVLFQVVRDDNSPDGVTAFVLATNFEEI